MSDRLDDPAATPLRAWATRSEGELPASCCTITWAGAVRWRNDEAIRTNGVSTALGSARRRSRRGRESPGGRRHDLARWLFFANQGEFRTGDYKEIMNKASCLSLLSNAVLVWNTVGISEIVARLRSAGETVSDKDLARISPLAYAHVIPNETYTFGRARRGFNSSLDMLP